jgi:hypothetical protein
MFEQLRGFRSVGWDVDDTIYQHGRSKLFWQFIHENPFGQEHHIVTFRSGGLEKRIFTDLTRLGSTLNESHFRGIHYIDHALWVNKTLILQVDPNDPYMLWKGKTCADMGIEVLIDDDTFCVKNGCLRHGVTLIHPDDLF